MRVLGIETSCDETAAAVVENGKRVVTNVVATQLALHRRFNGVVQELASRAHLQKIADVIEEARAGAGALDAVAYTRGPGLMGPLLVGKVAAQTLAAMIGVPLVPVHHLEGHIFAAELCGELKFPLAALIVSGGHTDLLISPGPGRYKVLGRTRDDAAGEAYDKVARLLGLGFPGGPAIDRRAKEGDAKAVDFPRPLMPETWDFSFAGLKTSVLYHVQKRWPKRFAGGLKAREGEDGPTPQETADLCASFQEALIETLVWKAMRAAKKYGVRQLVIGGGVAANSRLRQAAAARGLQEGVEVLQPPPWLCTDNGVMIAQVAVHRLSRRRVSRLTRCDPAMPFSNWGA